MVGQEQVPSASAFVAIRLARLARTMEEGRKIQDSDFAELRPLGLQAKRNRATDLRLDGQLVGSGDRPRSVVTAVPARKMVMSPSTDTLSTTCAVSESVLAAAVRAPSNWLSVLVTMAP
jgi:hypothetical protein